MNKYSNFLFYLSSQFFQSSNSQSESQKSRCVHDHDHTKSPSKSDFSMIRSLPSGKLTLCSRKSPSCLCLNQLFPWAMASIANSSIISSYDIFPWGEHHGFTTFRREDFYSGDPSGRRSSSVATPGMRPAHRSRAAGAGGRAMVGLPGRSVPWRMAPGGKKHGKTMGKSRETMGQYWEIWENHEKTGWEMRRPWGKPWEKTMGKRPRGECPWGLGRLGEMMDQNLAGSFLNWWAAQNRWRIRKIGVFHWTEAALDDQRWMKFGRTFHQQWETGKRPRNSRPQIMALYVTWGMVCSTFFNWGLLQLGQLGLPWWVFLEVLNAGQN